MKSPNSFTTLQPPKGVAFLQTLNDIALIDFFCEYDALSSLKTEYGRELSPIFLGRWV